VPTEEAMRTMALLEDMKTNKNLFDGNKSSYQEKIWPFSKSSSNMSKTTQKPPN
jgi:hypothetical protein